LVLRETVVSGPGERNSAPRPARISTLRPHLRGTHRATIAWSSAPPPACSSAGLIRT